MFPSLFFLIARFLSVCDNGYRINNKEHWLTKETIAVSDTWFHVKVSFIFFFTNMLKMPNTPGGTFSFKWLHWLFFFKHRFCIKYYNMWISRLSFVGAFNSWCCKLIRTWISTSLHTFQAFWWAAKLLVQQMACLILNL